MGGNLVPGCESSASRGRFPLPVAHHPSLGSTEPGPGGHSCRWPGPASCSPGSGVGRQGRLLRAVSVGYALHLFPFPPTFFVFFIFSSFSFILLLLRSTLSLFLRPLPSSFASAHSLTSASAPGPVPADTEEAPATPPLQLPRGMKGQQTGRTAGSAARARHCPAGSPRAGSRAFLSLGCSGSMLRTVEPCP